MKKVLISLIVVLLVLTTIFAFACKKDVVAEGEYTIVSPDGAPALALATFIKNSQVSEQLKINANVVSSTLIKSEAVKSDFAIVPANMAAILYNQGEEYKMVGAVTNGNMYFVSNVENNDFQLEDMIGHVLYSIGQGSVPAFIMTTLLKNANIPFVVSETAVEGKVAIHYVADGKTLIPKVKTAQGVVYGNLADPAVTNMVASGAGYRVADIQELWKESTSASIKGFAQAVLIAKKSLCEEKPEVVDAVFNAIKASESYIVENPQEARDLIASVNPATELPAKLSASVVTNCNVHAYRASANIDYIMATLNAAFAINPTSVGGSVPAKDSGFYY